MRVKPEEQTEATATAFSVTFSGVMIGYGRLHPFLKLLNTQPTSDYFLSMHKS